jgi:hypothetical protein
MARITKPNRQIRRAATAAVLFALAGMVACEREATDTKPSKPKAGTARPAPADSSKPADEETASSSDLQPVVGRWVRMDSPYVIEIQSAGDDGTLEASYYNPRPINVARAEARRKSGELLVFVELRDVNYPGCTYTLAYDPAQDRLQGVYFQAAMGQHFDVVFARLPAER